MNISLPRMSVVYHQVDMISNLFIKRLLILIFSFGAFFATAQVGIGEGTFDPDSSAVLHLKSNSKGLLIPRMDSSQRQTIANPAIGLMVFDGSTKSFWYHNPDGWIEIRAGSIGSLADKDNDTKVEVETTDDIDEIVFDIKGKQRWIMDSTSLYPVNSGGSVLIGKDAGFKNDYQARGTIAIGRRAAMHVVDKKHIIAIGDSTLMYAGTNSTNQEQGSENIGLGNRALKLNETGKQNLAVGHFSLEKNLTGSNNTALGLSALQQSSEADFNVAVGNKSLLSNLSGDQNVSVGMRSMELNETGSFNVAVGRQSLNMSTGSDYNTAIGQNALQGLTAGGNNTAVGAQSMKNGNDNLENVAVGFQAAQEGGSTSTIIGAKAHSTHQADNTIAIGHESMLNALGPYHIAIGNGSLRNNQTAGFNNLALGHFSMEENTTGKLNTAIGHYSLTTNLDGDYNLAMGYNALNNNDSGNDNLAIGYYSLFNNTDQSNLIAIGKNAGRSLSSAFDGIYIGSDAGRLNTNGESNIVIGHNAGNTASIGKRNILIGHNAGLKSVDSTNIVIGHDSPGGDRENVIIGNLAAMNGTQFGAIAIGHEAGRDSIGNGSVVIGHEAGSVAPDLAFSTVIGYKAGVGTQSGSSGLIDANVLIGAFAGEKNMDRKNTMIGYGAGQNHILGDENVFLGSFAGDDFTSGSNKLIIESTGSSNSLVYGDFATKELAINWQSGDAIPNTLSVNGNASKTTPGDWLGNSDMRLKKHIKPILPDQALNELLSIQGVRFEWDDQVTGLKRPAGIQTGFLAQDIQQTWPEKVSEDANGFLETAYGDFDPIMVESMRALNTKIEKQDVIIKELIIQLEEIKTLLRTND